MLFRPRSSLESRPGDSCRPRSGFDRWNPNPAGRMRVSQPSRRSSAPRTRLPEPNAPLPGILFTLKRIPTRVSKQGYQVGKQQSPLTRGRTSCCADPGPRSYDAPDASGSAVHPTSDDGAHRCSCAAPRPGHEADKSVVWFDESSAPERSERSQSSGCGSPAIDSHKGLIIPSFSIPNMVQIHVRDGSIGCACP